MGRRSTFSKGELSFARIVESWRLGLSSLSTETLDQREAALKEKQARDQDSTEKGSLELTDGDTSKNR